MDKTRSNVFTEVYRKMDYDADMPSKFMHTIDVELTNTCNFRCTFCCRKIMKRKQGFISDENFQLVLIEISEHRIPTRFIRWGEPFLHPKILDYIKMVKDTGAPLHITTNGTMLTEDVCRSLIDLELDSLIFSMQGTSDKEYNATRLNGSYDALADKIRMFSEMRGNKEKPFLTVTTTLEKGQGKDRERFIGYWKQYVDHVRVKKTVLTWFDNTILSNENHPVCYEPFRQLSVNWNGDVTACCGDYDGLLVIGNIHDNSLMELWNNDVIVGIRNVFSKGYYNYFTLCSKCDFGSITE